MVGSCHAISSACHPHLPWSPMPKPTPPRGPQHDPMAGVVDRLLAQLPGLQGQPEPPRTPATRSSNGFGPMNIVPRPEVSPQRRMLGMWFRVALALSLAVTMGWWPQIAPAHSPAGLSQRGNHRDRGRNLGCHGFLEGAQRTGSHHSADSGPVWIRPGRFRTAYWNGYAVDRATWQCEDPILDTTVSA